MTYILAEKNAFFIIVASILFALLFSCGDDGAVAPTPKPSIKITSQPSAAEGVPNLEYEFSASVENAPKNPKYVWMLDDSVVAALTSLQPVRLKFTQDGWYYVRIKLYDNISGLILAGDIFRVNIRSGFPIIATIAIPAGEFKMGSLKNYYEQPVHSVIISRNLEVGKYEIMQSEWRAVMGYSPSWFVGDSLPVENLTWNDAIDFCNRLSVRAGYKPCYSMRGDTIACDFNANGYRLPTEAEWEYFARAGAATDCYFGDFLPATQGCYPPDPSLDPIAWYCANALDATHNVGRKQPNAFGLYDAMGNVAEFCWDLYDGIYYQTSPVINPAGPLAGTRRVVRGGSFLNEIFTMRLSYRDSQYTSKPSIGNGLRVVRTLP